MLGGRSWILNKPKDQNLGTSLSLAIRSRPDRFCRCYGWTWSCSSGICNPALRSLENGSLWRYVIHQPWSGRHGASPGGFSWLVLDTDCRFPCLSLSVAWVYGFKSPKVSGVISYLSYTVLSVLDTGMLLVQMRLFDGSIDSEENKRAAIKRLQPLLFTWCEGETLWSI